MSYLIISNINTFDQRVSNEITRIEGKSVDINNNVDVVVIESAGEITVEQIRSAIKNLRIKPTVLGNKYLIIYNFNNANLNAQNAFLKTLEEGNCIIFLHAKNTFGILDTVLSRVKLEKIETEITPDKKITTQLENIIEKKDFAKISKLLKENEIEIIQDSLEFILWKNKSKKAIQKLYEYKKRSKETNLNNEIQLYNILLELA